MKRIYLTIFIILILTVQYSSAHGPISGDCVDDCEFTGTMSVEGEVAIGGTGRSIESLSSGAGSYLHFNNPSSGIIDLGSTGNTNNNILRIDLETTDNVATLGLSAIYHNYTIPAVADLDAFTIMTETTDGAGNSNVALKVDFTSNDADNPGLVYGIENILTIADTAHAGGETFSNYIGTTFIHSDDSGGAQTINAIEGGRITLDWDEQSADDDVTVTNLYGLRIVMKSSPAQTASTLTVTNYDGILLAKGGSTGTVEGTTWAQIRIQDLNHNAGSPVSLIGLIIEDLAEGDTNYGIVLDDGADGIYFEGITGPNITGNANELIASKAVGVGFYTGDPCGTVSEGTIWYNDTSDYMCFCDGGGVDKKVSDNGACF